MLLFSNVSSEPAPQVIESSFIEPNGRFLDSVNDNYSIEIDLTFFNLSNNHLESIASEGLSPIGS